MLCVTTLMHWEISVKGSGNCMTFGQARTCPFVPSDNLSFSLWLCFRPNSTFLVLLFNLSASLGMDAELDTRDLSCLVGEVPLHLCNL